MAEYRSIKNICLFLLNIRIQKTDHRRREPETLEICEVTAKCYRAETFIVSLTTCSPVYCESCV